ncbi:MAG: hypothetical protein MUC36_16140 [Planctomycetes bacterium]|jgi:hypothetical protein|nr:hypothetical protein [Planctomycetota bacterium]
MNAPDERSGPPSGRGRELVPDAWRELDDTLADAPSAAEVPDEAKAWLADQRTMHGLLRALHTGDAAAREGRIEALLARIDAEARPGARRWALVAMAAALLACAGLWLSLPASLPTAEAAMQRVVSELDRDVARRFRLQLETTDAKVKGPLRQDFALVTRPGGRFRVDGKTSLGALQFGEFRLGCDGVETWVTGGNGLFRRAVPLAERERLQQTLGDALDLGYLDVHDLVRRLPQDCELRVVGREQDAAGRSVLRIEASRKRPLAKARLGKSELLVDEATGMIVRFAAEVDFARAGIHRSVLLEYLGEEPPGLVDFGRPW